MAILLGIDPGFAALGWAIVEADRSKEWVVTGCGVIRTEPSKRKRGVRVSEDIVRRGRELHAGLRGVIDGAAKRVEAICAETLSLPRNSATAARCGVSWGVICAVASELRLPVVQSSPQELKRAVTGEATASKVEVATAIRSLMRFNSWPLLRGDEEHAADAASAVWSARESELVLALLGRGKGG